MIFVLSIAVEFLNFGWSGFFFLFGLQECTGMDLIKELTP